MIKSAFVSQIMGLLLALLLPVVAMAQSISSASGVTQSGSITSGNCVQWVGVNRISDYGVGCNGSGVATVVATIAALRAGNYGSSPFLNLTAYTGGSVYGGGPLILVSSDTTSADNGCTIFVDASSHRFYRQIPFTGLDISQCGALGDNSTDDTTAIQAAIALACSHSAGALFSVTIPAVFKSPISSTLSFKHCTGVQFGGTAAISGGAINPAIKWTGGNNGPIIDLNQANTVTIHHLFIDDLNTSADIVIDDTQYGTITNTNTYNELDDVAIYGPNSTRDANFVGIRIGFNNITGNDDVGRFNKVTLHCSGQAPTSNTSNGYGVQFVSSSAQPFVMSFTHTSGSQCSRLFDIHGSVSDLTIDGLNTSADYTELYISLGAGGEVTLRSARSETAVLPVVVDNGYAVHLEDDVFSGSTGASAVQVTSTYAGRLLIDTVSVNTSTVSAFDLSAATNNVSAIIQNSIVPAGQCPVGSVGPTSARMLSLFNRAGISTTCPSALTNVPLAIPSYTVANLPSSALLAAGMQAIVTDGNAACTLNATPAGGGFHVCFVESFNGTAWVETGVGA